MRTVYLPNSPIMDRWKPFHIHVETDVKSWLEWAKKSGINTDDPGDQPWTRNRPVHTPEGCVIIHNLILTQKWRRVT